MVPIRLTLDPLGAGYVELVAVVHDATYDADVRRTIRVSLESFGPSATVVALRDAKGNLVTAADWALFPSVA